MLADFEGDSIGEPLPSGHPARTGVFLTPDGKPETSHRKFRENYRDEVIQESLAVTAPNHCLDGWTFLSRSLSALISGDTHTTRHLAYYAQLRASLSLLHCNGIGIFNGINFAVDEDGTISDLGSDRTHVAVWKLLHEWSAQASSSRNFLKAIRFRGVSLSDCIGAIWPGTTTIPLASELIRSWGVDLMRMSEDRNFRNISSYCAQALNQVNSELPRRLELIRSIWRGVEPDENGGYPLLDSHMLRKFFHLVGREKSNAKASDKNWGRDYDKLDIRIRNILSLPFLTASDEEDDFPVLALAKDAAPGDVHGMLSRALLLLRLATGTVQSALRDSRAGEDMKDLKSWFNPVGVDRGFWLTDEPPDDYETLWDGVSYAVEILDKCIYMDVNDQPSLYAFLGNQFPYLSQAERACMWGIGT